MLACFLEGSGADVPFSLWEKSVPPGEDRRDSQFLVFGLLL